MLGRSLKGARFALTRTTASNDNATMAVTRRRELRWGKDGEMARWGTKGGVDVE